MRVSSNAIRAGLAALAAALVAPKAGAQVFGGPKPGEIGFLPTVTQNGDDIVWFHNWILLPVTIGISLMVLALIVYIVYRFNETANPTPSRRTHNGAARIRLDGRAGAGAGGHRGAVVPAARATSSSFPLPT